MVKQYAVVDCETSIIDNGHPFNPNAKLVVTGIMPCDAQWNQTKDVIYVYDNSLLQECLEQYSTLLLFNAKFDLHHIRRNTSIDWFKYHVRDSQYSEFLITNQRSVMPALDDIALKYLNEQKIDVVRTEYWEKGIDTSSIPKDILETYLEKDLDLTRRCYQEQEKILRDQGKLALYRLGCADLLVLQDMEYNGIKYDKENSLKKGLTLDQQLETLASRIVTHSSIPNFNINSGDHVSLLLYGGVHTYDVRVPVGLYKTGPKTGQPRYKVLEQTIECPRLVEPPPRSELKKEGFFSVDEQTLLSIKTKDKEVKQLIHDLLEYSKIEKLNGTYFKGLPKLINEKEWNDNIIHGQLNQCVAVTGRLSSSKPNQQNFDPSAKALCITRYST
jgi:DNA polymerase I-like protein with 3'-5' exonuclease and polymerase domains